MSAGDGSGASKELIEPKSDNIRDLSGRPDLAFISTRDGAPEVFIADARGSNVKRITKLAMGVQPPLIFSGDGSRLAFVSDIYPECADDACNKRRSEEIEKNPVKVHRLTRLLYRHWDEWRENVRHHIFVAEVQGGRAIDVTPGTLIRRPASGGRSRAFSPDGNEIALPRTARAATGKHGRRIPHIWSSRRLAARSSGSRPIRRRICSGYRRRPHCSSARSAGR